MIVLDPSKVETWEMADASRYELIELVRRLQNENGKVAKKELDAARREGYREGYRDGEEGSDPCEACEEAEKVIDNLRKRIFQAEQRTAGMPEWIDRLWLARDEMQPDARAALEELYFLYHFA